jgi:hypothetical protein
MSEKLEEPKYDLIRSFDSFEIRLYHDTIQARFAAKTILVTVHLVVSEP